jgi:hypothetical protein
MSERAIIEVIDSLDSTSGTNALSANQGRVLKEMIDTINAKDIITIKLEDSFNEESGGTYKNVPMILYNKIGDKLSLSNNGVLIGSGVSKVLVSSNLKVISNTTGNKHSRILKNGTTMCWTDSTSIKAGHEITINNTPVLIDVEQGDLITLAYFVLTTDKISGGQYTPTYLTVEVVQ